MTHWLLTFAVPKIENAALYTLTAGLVTTLILAPFRKLLKKLWRAIDSLDPETDSGVTKQLHELEHKIAHVPLVSEDRQQPHALRPH
jgi:hypothetical protein